MSKIIGEESTQRQIAHFVDLLKPELSENNIPADKLQDLMNCSPDLSSARQAIMGVLEEKLGLNPYRRERVKTTKKPDKCLGIQEVELQIACLTELFPKINVSGITKITRTSHCQYLNDSLRPVIIPRPSFLYRYCGIDQSKENRYRILIKHLLTCFSPVVRYSPETMTHLSTIRLIDPGTEVFWERIARDRDVCAVYISLTSQFCGWSPRSARWECKGDIIPLGLAQILPILMLCNISPGCLGTTAIADVCNLCGWSPAIKFDGKFDFPELTIGRREDAGSEFFANAVAFN